MQITPDGDYTQTCVAFNKVGYGNPHHTALVTAPGPSGYEQAPAAISQEVIARVQGK